MARILAFPLKRVAIARLRGIADGSDTPPVGATALVSTPVRPVGVDFFLGDNPERICVYGTPLRSQLVEATAEYPEIETQTIALELRVRVFEPGEDREGAAQTLGDTCDAVVAALVNSADPLMPAGRVWLASLVEAPQEVAGNPEPSVTAEASLLFNAQEVGSGA